MQQLRRRIAFAGVLLATTLLAMWSTARLFAKTELTAEVTNTSRVTEGTQKSSRPVWEEIPSRSVPVRKKARDAAVIQEVAQ